MAYKLESIRVKLKAAVPPAPPQSRFALPLLLLLIFLGVAGPLTYETYQMHLLVGDERRQVQQRKEEEATLRFDLNALDQARLLARSEQNMPHPTLPDRDARFIGGHVTVSWSYANDQAQKYIAYEVELTPFELFERYPPAVDAGSECERFIHPTIGRPFSFVATDPENRSTRIPPISECTLRPGRYLWRVAAAPPGAAVQEDDLKRLSQWSGYARFTLDASVNSRIVRTQLVRVGVNLEQGSFLARPESNGQVNGVEMHLVRWLIGNCLSIKAGRLFESCTGSPFPISRQGIDPICPAPGSADNVCAEFVETHKWENWETALSRKEIDIFVGSVTRARYREREGVGFSRGYLTYRTRLYTHRSDRAQSLTSWLSLKRTVGVIKGTSNETLLEAIRAHLPIAGLRDKIRVQSFASFPQMEDAMDLGQIDGVLIDEIFVERENWTPLADAIPPAAWRNYQGSFLGHEQEQIAIAVAQEDAANSGPSLLSLINDALAGRVTHRYMSSLCHNFWPGPRLFTCEVSP